MLINLSNHPSDKWDRRQLDAASEYGKIIDIPFPAVAPDGDEQYIRLLSDKMVEAIAGLAEKEDVTVHIMGEMTFTYLMVDSLLKAGISCIASTTGRIVRDNGNYKESEFRFIRFRRYGK